MGGPMADRTWLPPRSAVPWMIVAGLVAVASAIGLARSSSTQPAQTPTGRPPSSSGSVTLDGGRGAAPDPAPGEDPRRALRAPAGEGTEKPRGPTSRGRELLPEEETFLENHAEELTGLQRSWGDLFRANRRLRRMIASRMAERAPAAEALAERGELRLSLDDAVSRRRPVPSEVAADVGLDDAQWRAAEAEIAAAGQNLRAELEDIYGTLEGNPDAAEGLSTTELISGVRDMSDPLEFRNAVRAVARELAGMEAGVEGGAAAEALFRALVRHDQERQRRLTEALGEDVAYDLLVHELLAGQSYSYNVGGDEWKFDPIGPPPPPRGSAEAP